jgi:nucleoid DNA-binding protein
MRVPADKVGAEELLEMFRRSMAVTKTQARDGLAGLVQAVQGALAEGKTVEIRGIGTFKGKEVPAKAWTSPFTKEVREIPARRRVSFSPSSKLK